MEVEVQELKLTPRPQAMQHIATMRHAYEKSKEDWRLEEKWERAFSQVKEKELKSFEQLYQRARRELG